MRTAATLSAVMLIASNAVAASADVPAFIVESRTVDTPVTYRFAVDVERPQGAFDRGGPDDPGGPDGSGGGAPSGIGGSRPTPPPIQPQTIRFATFDLDHIRLTLLDDAGADTKETIVAERDPDGQLHAKLKRGSHWALPVALYDRMVVLAGAASEPVYPGKPVTAKLQPIAGSDDVDGTIETHAGKETHLIYDATGSVTPSCDLLGMTAGGPGRSPGDDPNGGPGGGGRGGMRGRGHGGGRGNDGQNMSRKADATVHVDAVFRNRSLVRADSAETLAFGSAGMVAKQSWSVVRIP